MNLLEQKFTDCQQEDKACRILLAYRRGPPKFLLLKTELGAGMRGIPGLRVVYVLSGMRDLFQTRYRNKGNK